MQKKLWKKLSLLAVVMLFVILISIPFFHPITVQGKFVPYEYTIHGTYVEINKYIGTETEVEIPAYLWCRPVKEISSSYIVGAFYDLDYVTYIKVPDTVTTLTSAPFCQCWNLKEIVLSKNIRVIPSGTFSNCDKLKKITLYDNVEQVNGTAFLGCDSLESVIFLNSNTKIGEHVFDNGLQSCNFDILTLVSAKDSAVEKYAKEHGIKWEELEE